MGKRQYSSIILTTIILLAIWLSPAQAGDPAAAAILPRDSRPIMPPYQNFIAYPSQHETAERYSPVIIQSTRLDLDPDADSLYRIDYDKDWNTANNQKNYLNYRAPAYLSYTTHETATDYFVSYYVYRPRDYQAGRIFPYACMYGTCHGNDLEGIMQVIHKNEDGSPGKLRLLLAFSHNKVYTYVPYDEWHSLVNERPEQICQGKPSRLLPDGSNCINGYVHLDPLGRIIINAESGGHGLYSWEYASRRDKKGRPLKKGVLFDLDEDLLYPSAQIYPASFSSSAYQDRRYAINQQWRHAFQTALDESNNSNKSNKGAFLFFYDGPGRAQNLCEGQSLSECKVESGAFSYDLVPFEETWDKANDPDYSDGMVAEWYQYDVIPVLSSREVVKDNKDYLVARGQEMLMEYQRHTKENVHVNDPADLIFLEAQAQHLKNAGSDLIELLAGLERSKLSKALVVAALKNGHRNEKMAQAIEALRLSNNEPNLVFKALAKIPREMRPDVVDALDKNSRWEVMSRYVFVPRQEIRHLSGNAKLKFLRAYGRDELAFILKKIKPKVKAHLGAKIAVALRAVKRAQGQLEKNKALAQVPDKILGKILDESPFYRRIEVTSDKIPIKTVASLLSGIPNEAIENALGTNLKGLMLALGKPIPKSFVSHQEDGKHYGRYPMGWREKDADWAMGSFTFDPAALVYGLAPKGYLGELGTDYSLFYYDNFFMNIRPGEYIPQEIVPTRIAVNRRPWYLDD